MPGDASAPAGGGGAAEGIYFFMMATVMALGGAFFLPPLLLFAPAPLAALVYRRGYRAGMAAGLLLAFGVFALQGMTLGMAGGLLPGDVIRLFQFGTLASLLLVGLVGLSIGGHWREGGSASATLLSGAAAFALPPLLAYGVAALGWQLNLVDVAMSVWVSLGEEIARQQQLGVAPPEALEQMAEWVAAAELSFTLVRPVLVGLGAMMAFGGSLGSMVLARWMLRRRTPTPEGFPPFQLWRFPWWVVLGFVMGQGLVVLQSLGLSLGLLGVLGDNLHLFFSNLFAVQGLAVVYYFLTRQPVPSALRVGVLFIAMFWLSPLVMWLGVLDSWFNFRRLSGDESGGDRPH